MSILSGDCLWYLIEPQKQFSPRSTVVEYCIVLYSSIVVDTAAVPVIMLPMRRRAGLEYGRGRYGMKQCGRSQSSPDEAGVARADGAHCARDEARFIQHRVDLRWPHVRLQ